MASLLRWTDKYMKERLQGLSCSSAASASVVVASGRAIDRHSPHLRDPHRRLPPSLPKPPSSPSGSASIFTSKDSPASSSSSLKQQQQQQLYYGRYGDGKDKRKKKATPSSAAGSGRSSTSTEADHKKNKKKAVQLQQVSPASSSRFLLNSSRLTMQSDDDITVVGEALPQPLPPPRPYFIDDDEDEDIFPNPRDAVLLPLPPVVSPMGPQLVGSSAELSAEPPAVAGSSSSGSSSEIGGHVVAGDKTAMVRSCSTRGAGQNQVVVLRVSLHCKGCAGKVKKHISKMEGEFIHPFSRPPSSALTYAKSCVCRRHFFRHRHRDEEGDSGGRRDAAGRPQQHLQG
ncbi:hypothetical protein U9M48_019722 [Paspalum notatum var. saurae]|uniref:HMA domain-containing protein n=1 Tax=Paspalum notatum var. saurae TaxID=547442 RepID=A0AAQ3TDN7_PASNO